MKIIPYVTFNGKAEAAIAFYKQVFGGEVELMRFDSMPADPSMPLSKDWKDKVMHGELRIAKDVVIYFSDTFEGMPVSLGDSITIHLDLDSEQEVRSLFERLSKGGKVTMPVEKTFWGAIYGSLIDQFGIPWGLHYQLPA